MRIAALLVPLLMLVGCATTQAPPPVPTTAVVPPPAAEPVGYDSYTLRLTAEAYGAVSGQAAALAITEANTNAIMRPRPEWFHRGILIYPWQEGRRYQITLASQRATDVIFQGEKIVLVKGASAEGENDGGWWDITDYTIQQGSTVEGHLIVVPKAPKLTTDLIVMTTARAYYLRLVSQVNTGLTAVRWEYPPQPTPQRKRYEPGIVHVGYTIKVAQGQPPWTPTSAFDANGMTYIQLAEAASVTEAPVVYVPSGKEKLVVNYTLHGTRIQVHQLAPVFELRVGHDKSADVVYVRRNADYRAIACPGVPECPPEVP